MYDVIESIFPDPRLAELSLLPSRERPLADSSAGQQAGGPRDPRGLREPWVQPARTHLEHGDRRGRRGPGGASYGLDRTFLRVFLWILWIGLQVTWTLRFPFCRVE